MQLFSAPEKKGKFFQRNFPKPLDNSLRMSIIISLSENDGTREWRNWQTRTFEGRVVTPYGFKSRFSHQKAHFGVLFLFAAKPKARRREDSSRAGGACTPCSRFMHLKVKSSPETVIFIANCRGGYYPPALHRWVMGKKKVAAARNPRGGAFNLTI